MHVNTPGVLLHSELFQEQITEKAAGNTHISSLREKGQKMKEERRKERGNSSAEWRRRRRRVEVAFISFCSSCFSLKLNSTEMSTEGEKSSEQRETVSLA